MTSRYHHSSQCMCQKLNLFTYRKGLLHRVILTKKKKNLICMCKWRDTEEYIIALFSIKSQPKVGIGHTIPFSNEIRFSLYLLRHFTMISF